MLGIKPVTLRGCQIKLGYTFDLRVHQGVQRAGIGKRLCNEVEARCVSAGVDTMYLSVNSDNPRAKALYAQLGYTEASIRAPMMELLLRTEEVWQGPPLLHPNATISEQTPEYAVRTLVESHGGRDCALTAAKNFVLVSHALLTN